MSHISCQILCSLYEIYDPQTIENTWYLPLWCSARSVLQPASLLAFFRVSFFCAFSLCNTSSVRLRLGDKLGKSSPKNKQKKPCHPGTVLKLGENLKNYKSLSPALEFQTPFKLKVRTSPSQSWFHFHSNVHKHKTKQYKLSLSKWLLYM